MYRLKLNVLQDKTPFLSTVTITSAPLLSSLPPLLDTDDKILDIPLEMSSTSSEFMCSLRPDPNSFSDVLSVGLELIM